MRQNVIAVSMQPASDAVIFFRHLNGRCRESHNLSTIGCGEISSGLFSEKSVTLLPYFGPSNAENLNFGEYGVANSACAFPKTGSRHGVRGRFSAPGRCLNAPCRDRNGHARCPFPLIEQGCVRAVNQRSINSRRGSSSASLARTRKVTAPLPSTIRWS